MKLAVIFSGAGLSAESGIPTFRASDGLWENHKVEEVASPEGWVADQAKVLRFYEQRFLSVSGAQPNDAHRAIARLQEGYRVVNITQNIDDLLERAGCSDVRHIHGSIRKQRCEHHKALTMLDGDPAFTCDYEAPVERPIQLGDLCPSCGGQMRPAVVWFGEPVDLNYESIKELVKEVKYNEGVFICVGTSAQVYPAASLIPFFSQVKNKHIVNLDIPYPIADYTLHRGTAGEILPRLVDGLLNEIR
jgi:NAD-dependent deacetylase